MTPEQIEMLKKLKAPIYKHMRSYVWGDSVYRNNQNGIVVGVFSCDVNILWRDDNCVTYYGINDEELLHVLPFCTPDGKRCLWEMLTEENKMKLLNSWVNYPSVYKEDIADPETAVLKALCEQEGV